MLQSIRERAQGWFAWAIVILISVPFALWGIQEYLGVGGERVAATVDDREITERDLEQAYQQFRQNLRQRLGSAYRPGLFDETQMRREVLENMIRDEVVFQASLGMGLGVSDAQVKDFIAGLKEFWKDGSFDYATYEEVLRRQGMSSAAFEGRVRRAIISEQLSNAVNASEFVTGHELGEHLRLREQQQDIDYLVIAAAADIAEPSAGDVEDYYQAHQADYRAAERVKLEYLELSAERVAAVIEPDEDTLRQTYQDHVDRYRKPERRRARHILFTVAEDADEAAAREKAQAALDRIRGGEDFAAVAKELSEDPGSAEQGGDLGFFERGIMDEAFEQSAYGLALGEISEPVRSQFGFHVIEVMEVEEGSTASFDEVRERVLEAHRQAEGERLFFEYAERLNDLSYEHPDSLVPAAEALALEIQTTDWLDRDGGEGVFATPKLMGAAFSEDVLAQGNNSEAIEVGTNHVVVVRVSEHQEAAIQPLDEVREQVIAALRAQDAKQQAREAGEKLVERLGAGEQLSDLAVAEGYELKQAGSLRRDSRDAPRAVVQAAFRLARPEGADPVYGQAVLEDGGFAVLALREVRDGDPASLVGDAKQRERAQLARVRGRRDADDLVSQLRREATVTIGQ